MSATRPEEGPPASRRLEEQEKDTLTRESCASREVLRRLGGARTAALPAQVLSEFGGACLKELEPRPDAVAIRREVERLMLAFPVLPLTGPVVLEAMRGVGEHLLSYYEAQISGRATAPGRWP